MQRINIVGATGAGKSTFAKRLSQQFGYPCIALDDLSRVWLHSPQEAEAWLNEQATGDLPLQQ